VQHPVDKVAFAAKQPGHPHATGPPAFRLYANLAGQFAVTIEIHRGRRVRFPPRPIVAFRAKDIIGGYMHKPHACRRAQCGYVRRGFAIDPAGMAWRGFGFVDVCHCGRVDHGNGLVGAQQIAEAIGRGEVKASPANADGAGQAGQMGAQTAIRPEDQNRIVHAAAIAQCRGRAKASHLMVLAFAPNHRHLKAPSCITKEKPMTALPDDLAEEFAGKGEIIHRLKLEDGRFRRLLEDNHTLWKEIQQIQKGIAPAEDEALETLEKKRLVVLDELASAIAAAEAG
jgi:uncharacterized protein